MDKIHYSQFFPHIITELENDIASFVQKNHLLCLS